ncbi:MAG: hypothetical protein V3T70_07785 [Phycisphaerae bacterium]
MNDKPDKPNEPPKPEDQPPDDRPTDPNQLAKWIVDQTTDDERELPQPN